MTLGEYIKAYRRAHGESQRAFANRCGISNTNISFIERGINPKTGRPIAPDLATLLYERGVDVKAAANVLGHSDEALTARLYEHFRQEQLQSVFEKLNRP